MSSTKVITPIGSLSYPHLDKPQSMDGGDPKYSATLVFLPGADLKALEAAALAAAEAKWPGKSAEMFRKQQIRTPFRRDAEAKGYPEGSTFINLRATQKPGCVYAHADQNNPQKPALVPDDLVKKDLYAGCQARASVSAFAYDRNGNKGVSFGLNNIQKMGEGPRLDGRKAADDEFTVDLNAAPADLAELIS